MNRTTLWLIGAANALLPLTAFSQSTTAADSGTLEEIVVTAEKRVENIQDVPIAITAYSESDLRAKGVVAPTHARSALPRLPCAKPVSA
jgi:iron complex outermembrane receptor protein